MQSSDILHLSKLLYASVDPQDRPMLNNIVGRTYYSCFHKLQEVACWKLQWPESTEIKGGTHEKMISRLDNHDQTDPQKLKLIAQIKKDLILLKKKRVNADYYLDVITTKLDVNYCIATADKLFERLDSI
ncbi:hypothetical protein [Acinetobacter haemolyticus]|uniref:hypothetical protein n=1 Tax=Acinetobacter haemolyticus TaxID=29430 RepID=UPI000E59766F|nr:hypothetical protein [Acinetobacter haemolyticus]QDJ92681.1 hypothetical protein AhaeAN54_011655 [Acinetobacter haemolyticus]